VLVVAATSPARFGRLYDVWIRQRTDPQPVTDDDPRERRLVRASRVITLAVGALCIVLGVLGIVAHR